MLDVYEKKRIKLDDFRHPVRPALNVKKRFIDCEIFGPTVVLMTNDNYISPMHCINCDLIHIAFPNVIYNVIGFESCQFIGCQFYEITSLINENMKDELEQQYPIAWLNRANPVTADDNPSP